MTDHRIRRPRAPWILILLLALGAALPARSAEARGEPGPIRAVREQLRERLHAMADFCTSRKLFGERYDVYALIVDLWPDDEEARKSNGYERTESGWSSEPRKRPRNLAAGGLPALRALQAETAAWYLAAIDEATADMPRGLAAAWRARAIGDAARIAPDDEALRAKNGEVKGKRPDGKRGWILQESKHSRARRGQLLAAAEKALKGAPRAKKDAVHANEKSSTVTWSTALQGGHARVLGTTGEDELAQILRNVDATHPFFEAAFGRKPPAIANLTVHVVDDIATGNAYLADRPGVKQDWLKFQSPLIAVWIPRSARVLVKSPDPTTRLEAGPRMVNGAHMSRSFGTNSKMGWAVEGFGLYLTWHLTGTRLINAVRQSQYGEQTEEVDLAARMRESDTDWVAEARRLVAGPDAPDLRLLLGKTVNTMTAEDVLYSYIFVMWLVEGHRDALPGFLPAVADVNDADYDLAFAEHLGFDVATAQRRVKRWLAETADLPGH